MRQEMEHKINIFNWQYSFEHWKVSMLIEKLANLLSVAHDIYKKLDFLLKLLFRQRHKYKVNILRKNFKKKRASKY